MKFFEFTSTAWAQAADAAAAAPKGPSLWESMALPVGLFVIMYFMIIRPQHKKSKDQQEFITKLKAGDEVVTSGGIIGRVRSIAETFVTVDVAQNTALKVMKSHVSPATKAPAPAASKEQTTAG